MNDLARLQGMGAGEPAPKMQRKPAFMVEALPGGYIITQHGGDHPWPNPRQSVVGNRDQLLGAIAGWARDCEARELTGDGNVGKG